MKEKKHIDKLFQDSFKNFEAEPSPEVWKNIQAHLKKEKEDRKVIPLWWKLGGVAALLALLLTVGNYVFNPSEIDPTIVTQEDTSSPNEDNDSDNTKSQNTNNEVLLTETDSSPSSNKSQDAESDNSQLNKQSTKDQIYKKKVDSENALAVEESTNKSKINNNYKDPINKNNTEVNSTEKAVVAIRTQKNPSEEKIQNIDSQKNDDLIIKDAGITETTDTKIANTEVIADPSKSDPNDEEQPEEITNKRSLIDVVNEQNEKKEAEAIANNETQIDNRWSVSPNVAPVYYSSLSEGSSLDPTFSDNPQNGNVNISYGVNVGYSLSEKLSIRSGLSNVSLGYSTGGLELGTGPLSSALKSINYDKNNSVIIPVDKGSLGGVPSPDGSGFGNITPKSTNGEAELVQNITYYEVPLELQFGLINNRFGIDMIGGFSTLFLGNNEVTVNAGDFRTSLGEANNLNSVSFTTNIGLGLNYQISKKLKFNIEPIFKYQLNPYSDSSVEYKPYYIGVYSGLSFKF